MQRRGAVLATGIDGQTGSEHQADSGDVVIAGGVGDLAVRRFGKASDNGGILGEQRLDSRLIASPARG